MKTAAASLVLAVPLLAAALVARDVETFPASAPADVGIDPVALELLAEEIARLVADDSMLGAEIHVIQDRQTVLHEAFGAADRDAERPLEVDAVYCIRSMTKPFVGTAIQMLLDEGRLTLDTKVSEILESWDTPATRDVTIDHLLTHTSGLPFTTFTRPLTDYATLQDVAAEAATTERLFAEGEGFQYSDGGSDTLGAVVAEVTGRPVEVFLQERLLDPLGMADTHTLLAEGDPVLDRIPGAYSGGAGAWSRHWSPDDGPMFPLFLTSQAAYATTTDYARFLALWMDDGRDLLSPEAVARGLTSRNSFDAPCGFDGLEMTYGQQWIVYPDERGRTVAFGHNGSDGTFAWAWPERDLIVLVFTQSRGTLAGGQIEQAVDRLLLAGDVEGWRAERAARELAAEGQDAYAGLYWDEDNVRAYYVVREDGGRLVIERPGGFRTALLPTATPGHFALEQDPTRILEFEPPEEGASPAFLFPFGNRTERQVRHRVNPRLPAAEDVVADVRDAHVVDAWPADLGTVRMTGTIVIRARGMDGTIEMLFDARRLRMTVQAGPAREVVWVTEDDRVFTQLMDQDPTELSGSERFAALVAHPLRRLGDWTADYATVEVLRPVVDGENACLLVRTEPTEGFGSTKLVDAETSLLVAEDRLESIPGLGTLGLRVAYGDLREVGGVLLPFRIVSEYAHPLLGTIDITFDEVEVGVDAEDELAPPTL